MRKIIFINRNSRAGFSIYKVSKPIIDLFDNKDCVFLPEYGATIPVLLRNLRYIKKIRERHAIHHITGDVHYGILALLGYKTVLNVHDTVSLDFNKISKLKKFIIEWLWYRIPLKYATKVTCISEQTKKSLQRLTKRRDITVVPDPIDTSLIYSPLKPIKNKPNILFIGVKENKNLIRCFEALSGIECFITIVGKLKEDQMNALKQFHIDYRNVWNLSDAELNDEYYKCDIVSFCSLYEGFGMPALEANQAGRPVICSNIPVLKEVAGNSACYVDPYDVSSIRNGYLRLISDENYRISLVEMGRRNVLLYKPEVIKARWDEIYNDIK